MKPIGHPEMTPLYVDMDGTLLRGDSLHEALVALLGRPTDWAPCLLALIRSGKAGFKREVGLRTQLRPQDLAYRADFLAWIRGEIGRGRKVYLATGADAALANQVAGFLGMHGFLASDGKVNLTGSAKLAAIRAHAAGGRFSYAGNDSVDLPIWQAADGIILASSGTRYASRFMSEKIEACFPDEANRPREVLRLLRPHQWAKNILIFLPALAAHRIQDPGVLVPCLWMFAAFSLCASGVYVMNDILDAPHDRAHSEKRRRPIAAGSVTIPLGIVLAGFLPVLSLVLAWQASLAAVAMVAGYWMISSFYSLRGKRQPVLDVFLLAGLYAFRALAGALPVPTGISTWMVAFLLFLFLSLACLKRYTELDALPQEHAGDVRGRGYQGGDKLLVAIFGVASGFIATLVVCLYAGSAAVAALYPRPSYLLGAGPLVLYGLCRIWLAAWRGKLPGDPVLFAVKDPASYLLFLLAVGCAALASIG